MSLLQQVAQTTGTARNAQPEELAFDDILERPASIVIVSGLHLGSGRNAATGRADCRENFFGGEAFHALFGTSCA